MGVAPFIIKDRKASISGETLHEDPWDFNHELNHPVPSNPSSRFSKPRSEAAAEQKLKQPQVVDLSRVTVEAPVILLQKPVVSRCPALCFAYTYIILYIYIHTVVNNQCYLVMIDYESITLPMTCGEFCSRSCFFKTTFDIWYMPMVDDEIFR